MALGGGIFTKQDKVLPGSYINFVSMTQAKVGVSERGYVAMPLELEWGPEGKVFTLKAEAFQENSQKLFGYPYKHGKMKKIRDIFKTAKVLFGYRVNGKGEKASCEFGTAKYAGSRGNDLRIAVSLENEIYTVRTFLDNQEMDVQKAAGMDGLHDNDYVIFNREAVLKETAGIPFAGGTDAEPSVEDYKKFLDSINGYSFQALGLPSDNEEVKALFAEFTKSMRDEMGIKFQTVLFRYAGDYEGIVSLENGLEGSRESGENAAGKAAENTADEAAGETEPYGLIYWTTGAIAGCAVNASNTNRTYDGEFEADVSYTQKQLAEAILAGKFMFHRVGDEVRVLEDINTLVTYTEEKGKDFSGNQTIRVLDQIGNDIAALFGNKYIGKIPNDEAGRVSFWNDVVTYYRELETMRAIENFKADDIVITKGEGKKSIVASCPVTPINAMSQLYMTVIVE